MLCDRSRRPLTGGREFFESLVRVVSSYAQEFMSGVHYPDRYGLFGYGAVAQN